MTNEQWGYWRLKLEPVLKSKQEEWIHFGHSEVTEQVVWDLFITRLEKKKEKPETIHVHWLVQELMHLSVNDYMTTLTVDALKGPDLFADGKALDLRSDRERALIEEEDHPSD